MDRLGYDQGDTSKQVYDKISLFSRQEHQAQLQVFNKGQILS